MSAENARPATERPARVLVTGATGYIGGLLVPLLLDRGLEVRVMVRDPGKAAGKPWAADVETVAGDVFDLDSLSAAFEGVDVLYYLVHSMGGGGGDFRQRDRMAASNTALVAREQRVGRIIYLGGLGATDLSEHLASRQEVGRVLGERGVPVTEFRAAVIVGDGSISFTMVRSLADRLPVMITPRWVQTRIQPIAEADVLRFLTDALDTPESVGRVIEIGGKDVLTYGEMLTRYSAMRGQRRYLIPVPVLTPTLSSYWVDLVTPIPASIAHPLIEGMKTEVIVRDPSGMALFCFAPMGYDEAVRQALGSTESA